MAKGSSNDRLGGDRRHAGTLFEGLRRDRRGAVAATVALVLVPLVIAVGLAVDVGRAVAARAPVDGRVVEVLIRPGMEIRELGAVVARLEPR